MPHEGFISEADAAILLGARDVLRKLEATAQDQSHRASLAPDAFELGRFAEACERASDDVFNALNVASALLRDDVARRALRA